MAIDYGRKGLRIAQEKNIKQDREACLKDIGTAYLKLQVLDSAVRYAKLARELYQKKANLTGVAGTSNNLGMALEAKGQVAEAFRAYNQGLKFSMQADNLFLEAMCLNNIGRLYDNRDKFQKALLYYGKALEIYEKLGHDGEIARAYNNLGSVYEKRRDYPKSLEFFEKALESYKKLGDELMQAQLLDNIGVAHIHMQETKKAIGYHNKAIQLYTKRNLPHEEALSLLRLAEAYKRLGKPDSSLRLARQALELSGDFALGVIQSQQQIAEDYQVKGDLEQAIAHFHKSLDLALETGQIYLAKQLHHSLAQAYEQNGQYQKALEQQRLHTQMLDSVFTIKKVAELNKAEVGFELDRSIREEKRKEAEERRKAEEARKRRNNIQYSAILIGIVMVFGAFMVISRKWLSPTLIERLIFFLLLIIFEFVLLVSGPYVSEISDDMPVYALAINSGIALAFSPLHSKLEQWLARLSKK